MKNRTVRLVALVAACLVLTMAAIPAARADVIVEPDNDFYLANAPDMEYVGLAYYANGQGGAVDSFDSPGAGEAQQTIPNGMVLYVEYGYEQDGRAWAMHTSVYSDGTAGEGYEAHDFLQEGWVPLDDLVRVYDASAFLEDADHTVTGYSGNKGELPGGGEVVVWSYPGSGEVYYTIDLDDTVDFAHSYIDPDGREWADIIYFMGIRDLWVCLDDPANEDIPAFNAKRPTIIGVNDAPGETAEPSQQASEAPADATATPAPEETAAPSPTPPSQQDGGGMSTGLIVVIILVAVLVIATAALILFIYGKNRNMPRRRR